MLILVLWQVCHENRSRNTEGRNSLDWRQEVRPHSISVTALAGTQTWRVGEHKTRAPHWASGSEYVACVPVWVRTQGLIDLAPVILTFKLKVKISWGTFMVILLSSQTTNCSYFYLNYWLQLIIVLLFLKMLIRLITWYPYIWCCLCELLVITVLIRFAYGHWLWDYNEQQVKHER